MGDSWTISPRLVSNQDSPDLTLPSN
jgi:hypothetical protein